MYNDYCRVLKLFQTAIKLMSDSNQNYYITNYKRNNRFILHHIEKLSLILPNS
jgi:hypothetical protein